MTSRLRAPLHGCNSLPHADSAVDMQGALFRLFHGMLSV